MYHMRLQIPVQRRRNLSDIVTNKYSLPAVRFAKRTISDRRKYMHFWQIETIANAT